MTNFVPAKVYIAPNNPITTHEPRIRDVSKSLTYSLPKSLDHQKFHFQTIGALIQITLYRHEHRTVFPALYVSSHFENTNFVKESFLLFLREE